MVQCYVINGYVDMSPHEHIVLDCKLSTSILFHSNLNKIDIFEDEQESWKSSKSYTS